MLCALKKTEGFNKLLATYISSVVEENTAETCVQQIDCLSESTPHWSLLFESSGQKNLEESKVCRSGHARALD